MSASNGHAAKPIREQLREARQAVQLERARVELTSIRAQHFSAARLLQEGYEGYTGAAWGDAVDPQDAFRDVDLATFGNLWVDRGYARRDGYGRPFIWSDLQLDLARSASRYLATRNGLAIGALSNLRNYAIKTGFKYDCQPRESKAHDATAAALAAQVNACLKDNHRVNDWPQREREVFWESRRDGEHLTRHFPQPDGTTWVRAIVPEIVYQPLASPRTYTFGILVDEDDVETPREYACHYRGPDTDCSYVREDSDELAARYPCEATATSLKLNVDRCVKRGLPDFYATGSDLEGLKKLLGNMLGSGAVQAAIAWIEQFTAAVGGTVQSQISSRMDQGRQPWVNPVTGQPTNWTKYEKGSIVKVGAGKQFLPPPIPVGASIHIQIVQAALRAVGARWCMPEYMISGDASNANYSSTLVSGSPFVNAIECEQGVYKTYFLRTQWIFVRNAARAGRFRIGGHVFTYAEIRELVEIHATAPAVAIANQKEEADRDFGDMDRGVLSIQTRRETRGLDNAKEDQNLAEKPLPKPPAPPSPFGGGNPPPPPGGRGGPGAFGESVAGRLEALRERYGGADAESIAARATRLLESLERPAAVTPAEPVVVNVQAPAAAAAAATPAGYTLTVQRDSHGRAAVLVREPIAATPSVGELLEDVAHKGKGPGGGQFTSGGGGGGGGAGAKDAPAADDSAGTEKRAGTIAARVAGHLKVAVGAGIRKALDALDAESTNGASLILGGIASRSPAAIAHGISQCVNAVWTEVHEEIFETALGDASGFTGAHAIAGVAAKVIGAGERLLLRGIALAMRHGHAALGLAEALAAGGEPSPIDRAILAACAGAALDALRHVYESAGVEGAKLPDAGELAGRIGKRLAGGAVREAKDSGGYWITIKGEPVFVGKNGLIQKGPKALKDLPAKPPAKPEPKPGPAKPAKEEPAAAKPADAPAAPGHPEHERHRNAVLDGLETALRFKEGMHGTPDVATVYHQARRFDSSLTPEKFKAALTQMGKDGDIELHVRNEVRDLSDADRELHIERNDKLLGFVSLPTKHQGKRPTELKREAP